MNDTQTKMGEALLKGIVQIRAQKGTLSLEDIGGIFMNVASSVNEADGQMRGEISKLAEYIADAKQDIFTITSNEKPGATLGDASQHLDEVIKASESASHSIMDATDAIQGATAGIGGEKEQVISGAINRIYEACNFQDINGQRITKVIKLLGTIEDGISKINTLFGSEQKSSSAGGKAQNGDGLLNGPQLASHAPSQADVDALLASLSDKN